MSSWRREHLIVLLACVLMAATHTATLLAVGVILREAIAS